MECPLMVKGYEDDHDLQFGINEVLKVTISRKNYVMKKKNKIHK